MKEKFIRTLTCILLAVMILVPAFSFAAESMEYAEETTSYEDLELVSAEETTSEEETTGVEVPASEEPMAEEELTTEEATTIEEEPTSEEEPTLEEELTTGEEATSEEVPTTAEEPATEEEPTAPEGEEPTSEDLTKEEPTTEEDPATEEPTSEEPTTLEEEATSEEELTSEEETTEEIDPLEGVAASGTCGTNLTWSLSDDGILTISGTGEMEDCWSGSPWGDYSYDIKEVIVKTGVTSIADRAFRWCWMLESVTLPSTVVTIGMDAFSDCSELTQITIPNGVQTIGDCAFEFCYQLRSLTIPASVTSIGEQAFRGCHGLEQISVQSGNTAYNSQNSCNALIETATGKLIIGCPSTVIPEGVKTIGEFAFQSVVDLTQINIPLSVETIERYAFDGCARLETVLFEGTQEDWDAIDIAEGNSPLKTAYNSVLSGQCGDDLYWTFDTEDPDAVFTITGSGAMYDYSIDPAPPWTDIARQVKAVQLPQGLTHIGSCAFNQFLKITEIDLPDTLQEIGNGAFMDCKGLTSIEIPEGVVRIGMNAFGDCWELADVSLPDSLRIIDEAAFSSCYALSQIAIPEGVTDIRAGAFHSSGLTSFEVPANITVLEDSLFERCNKLTSIVIPDYVTAIEGDAFKMCSLLEEVIIPDSVTQIGASAFADCTSLTEIHLPETLTSLPEGLFSGCTSLTQVNIPAGVSALPANCFQGCTSLQTISIATGVTQITCAFANSGLTDVYYGGTERQWNKIRISYEELYSATDTVLPNATIHYIDPPTHVTLEGQTTLMEGESTHLDAVYDLGIDYFITTYTSSDLSIASVNEQGNVCAWKPGTVTITGRFEDTEVKDTIEITVVAREVVQERDTIELSDGEVTYNKDNNNYFTWTENQVSFLTQTDGGSLMRVEQSEQGYVMAEYTDVSGKVVSAVQIPLELEQLAGFLDGEEYYYLVFTVPDYDKIPGTEIMRVVKYDKEWNRLIACSVCSDHGGRDFTYIRRISNAGTTRMAEQDGVLYIQTSMDDYRLYTTEYHQSGISFEIRESDMTFLDGINPFVSHDFNQFVKIKDGMVYSLNHNDGNPIRGISLYQYPVYGTEYRYREPREIFYIEGEIGANYTGISVGGFELGESRGIVAFNYDEKQADHYNSRNIYVASIDLDPEGGLPDIIQITPYDISEGIFCGTPTLVKISDWQFLLMWREIRYRDGMVIDEAPRYAMATIDQYGNIRDGIIYSKQFALSDCQPVVLADGTVSWYVTNGNLVKYYNIDPYHLVKQELSGIPVDRIWMSPSEIELTKGCTFWPESKVFPVDADNQKIWWSSSDESIATVDEQGIIQILETGDVVITGVSDENPAIRTQCRIHVVPCSGWDQHDGIWYYINDDGSRATGWKKINSKWYYFASDGAMKTSWQKIGSKWYYFSGGGIMQTGWKQVSDKWYYLGTDGVMRTKWQQVSGKWYYLGTSGVMQTKWQQVGGKWYYLGTNGVMQTGWVKVSGKWYYLGTDGVMRTGWQKISKKWYYFGTDGVMRTDWQKISKKWYYFGTSGVMVTGTQTIGGKTYTFGSDGVWTGK